MSRLIPVHDRAVEPATIGANRPRIEHERQEHRAHHDRKKSRHREPPTSIPTLTRPRAAVDGHGDPVTYDAASEQSQVTAAPI